MTTAGRLSSTVCKPPSISRVTFTLPSATFTSEAKYPAAYRSAQPASGRSGCCRRRWPACPESPAQAFFINDSFQRLNPAAERLRQFLPGWSDQRPVPWQYAAVPERSWDRWNGNDFRNHLLFQTHRFFYSDFTERVHGHLTFARSTPELSAFTRT